MVSFRSFILVVAILVTALCVFGSPPHRYTANDDSIGLIAIQTLPATFADGLSTALTLRPDSKSGAVVRNAVPAHFGPFLMNGAFDNSAFQYANWRQTRYYNKRAREQI